MPRHFFIFFCLSRLPVYPKTFYILCITPSLKHEVRVFSVTLFQYPFKPHIQLCVVLNTTVFVNLHVSLSVKKSKRGVIEIARLGLYQDTRDHPIQRPATTVIWVPIQMHISLGGKGGLGRSRFDTVQYRCYSYHHLMSLVLQAMTVKIKYSIWWTIVIEWYIYVICFWSLPASPLALLACLRPGVVWK